MIDSLIAFDQNKSHIRNANWVQFMQNDNDWPNFMLMDFSMVNIRYVQDILVVKWFNSHTIDPVSYRITR